MRTLIGVVGMPPLHMVAPPSDDPRRLNEFPAELVAYLTGRIDRNDTPRDIVNRDAIRNALIVAMAVGGSTNVLLHALNLMSLLPSHVETLDPETPNFSASIRRRRFVCGLFVALCVA